MKNSSLVAAKIKKSKQQEKKCKKSKDELVSRRGGHIVGATINRRAAKHTIKKVNEKKK